MSEDYDVRGVRRAMHAQNSPYKISECVQNSGLTYLRLTTRRGVIKKPVIAYASRNAVTLACSVLARTIRVCSRAVPALLWWG